ncbi:MAG: hypothetical protein ABIQ86_14270 [Steroidobacteraceae bacterium]
MDIAKFRGGMTAVLAALTLTSVVWSAEKPVSSLPRAVDRPAANQGLNNPALKLSDSQKAQLKKIMESYLAEANTQATTYATPDATPSAEVALARKQSRERMMAAVDQVLDAPQRRTLKIEQAARAEQAALAAKAAKEAFAARGASQIKDQPRER